MGIIDKSQILNRMMDDPEIVILAVDAFLKEVPVLLTQAHGAHPAEAVHALKGALAVFGESKALSLVQEIDQLCKSEQNKKIALLVPEMEAQIHLFAQELLALKISLAREGLKS